MPDHLWSFVTSNGIGTLERILNNSKPLEDWADVSGSSTVAEGSEFPHVLSSLQAGLPAPENAAKFLITGSIGRFEQRWATRQIAYMHQPYIRPILGLVEPVPMRRRQQARTSKLILAKVSLAPKAFADHNGEFAAAYCTYVFPQENVSLRALTGILNSNVVAFAARLMYGALAMSGGYIGFQPPQLRRIPVCDLTDVGRIKPLEDTVIRLEKLHQELLGVHSSSERQHLIDNLFEAGNSLNEIVFDLYSLNISDREVITDFLAKRDYFSAEPEQVDDVDL